MESNDKQAKAIMDNIDNVASGVGKLFCTSMMYAGMGKAVQAGKYLDLAIEVATAAILDDVPKIKELAETIGDKIDAIKNGE